MQQLIEHGSFRTRGPGVEIQIFEESGQEVTNPWSRSEANVLKPDVRPSPKGTTPGSGRRRQGSTSPDSRKGSAEAAERTKESSQKGGNQETPNGDFLTLLFLTEDQDEIIKSKMQIMESEEVAAYRREVGNLASTVVSRAFRKTIQNEKLRREKYELEQQRIEEVAHKSVLRLGADQIMMGATLLSTPSSANLKSLVGVHRGLSSKRWRSAERRKSTASPMVQQRSKASAIVDAAAQGNAKVLGELLRDRLRPLELMSAASKGSHRRLQTPTSPRMSPRRRSLAEAVDMMRHENLNLPDITGKTPLQAALERQSWPCVRLLLGEAEVDPSVSDSDGNQPLHSFLGSHAIHKHRDILRTLLRNNFVSVNARNLAGVTPLMVAAANRELAEAEAVLIPSKLQTAESGAGDGALDSKEDAKAATEGRPRRSERKEEGRQERGGGDGGLRERLGSAESTGRGEGGGVVRLRSRGDDEAGKRIIEILLDVGARADEEDESGRCALDHAAQAGALDHLRLLAALPTTTQAQLDSALLSVVNKQSTGDVSCLQFLLHEAKAQPIDGGQGGESALTAAARNNKIWCLKSLLKALPIEAVGHRDASGATCLHAAAAQGNNESARIVIEAVCEAEKPKEGSRRRRGGRVPEVKSELHKLTDEILFNMVAEARNVELLIELLQHAPHMKNVMVEVPASTSGEGSERTPLLSWAIRIHSVVAVKALMEMEVDVNKQDEGGEQLSPLMIAVHCLSQSTWASLAMESLEKGQDEPYISLRDVVRVVHLTKPEVSSLAESLKDMRGNPLRSPTGRQLFNRNPWRFSWHGFMAVCSAVSPDLGQQIMAYSMELADYMHIFELIMRSGRADMNQECAGRTAAAVAAAGANWKVFEDLRRAGARLGHHSVVLAAAQNNHPTHLAHCLDAVRAKTERELEQDGLSEGVCKNIFDVTCAAGHVHCATLLYEFSRTRDGWRMELNEQLMDAVEKQHHWMIDFLVGKGQSEQTKGEALLRCTDHGDFRSLQKLLSARTNPNFQLNGRSALTIAGAAWGRSGSLGHYEILVSLLRRGADAAKRDEEGMTVLMWAAARGHEKLMRLALSSLVVKEPAALGHLLDAQDKRGRTALMYAAMSLDAPSVNLLLEHRANPDLISNPAPDLSSPPLTALAIVTGQCSRSWPSFLNDLVRATTELGVVDAKGDSFVVWAARWGHTEGMRVAIEGRARKRLALDSKREPSALELAVMCRHEEITMMLLSCWDRHTPNQDSQREGPYIGMSVLSRAVEYDWPQVLEVLVDRFPGLNPAHPSVRSALHSCIERRWLRGLRGLLDRGVNPNSLQADEPPPLLEACKLDEPRQVQALLNAAAEGIEAAVVMTLFLGHMDCFKLLWKQVTKSPDLLRAAACMAALMNRFEALKTIMHAAREEQDMHIYGRKVAAIMAIWVAPRVLHKLSPLLFQLMEMEDPSAPLLCAVSKGNFRCTSYLLECKADALAKDDNNISPIQWACAVGNLDIVKILLKYGAPVSLEEGQTSNSFSDMRKTYQLNAIQRCRRYLTRVLRSANDIAHKIQLCVSPLLAALLRGHHDVARLLLEAGADTVELREWCNSAMETDARLEPLLRRMLETVLELEDFKAYGPFGVAGFDVNNVDIHQIPLSGRLRSVVVQFSEADWALVAIQFVHEVNGRPYECTVHRTTAPHAGEFQGNNRFKHLERLDLEEKEYIIQAEIAITENCIAGLRFTTNYRVCKWLGEEATAGSGHRLVTIAPQGREIVGLFSAVYDRFYLVGFVTRLRMGDFSWRSLRKDSAGQLKAPFL